MCTNLNVLNYENYLCTIKKVENKKSTSYSLYKSKQQNKKLAILAFLIVVLFLDLECEKKTVFLTNQFCVKQSSLSKTGPQLKENVQKTCKIFISKS